MTIVEFAAHIQARQRQSRKDKHGRIWIPTATPASSLGYRCERRLVYQRVSPQLAAPPNEELSSIFTEGDMHHTQIRAELTELGFEVMDQETEFYDERLQIKGHIDGRIRFDGRRVPFEAKSTAGSGPSSQDDWRASDGLVGRYYTQLQTYLFLTASPEGLGLFKNKLTGLWNVCAVDLDYERAEEALQRAERVRDAVKLKMLPDRLLDRSECRGCPFELECLPGDAPVDPILLSDDAELLADLAQREALARDAKTHKQIDERIKERFRLTKGDRFAIGSDWLVTKKVATNGAVTVKTERLTPGPSDGGSIVASPHAG